MKQKYSFMYTMDMLCNWRLWVSGADVPESSNWRGTDPLFSNSNIFDIAFKVTFVRLPLLGLLRKGDVHLCLDNVMVKSIDSYLVRQ